MIRVISNGDTSDFKISGNAEEVAREYAALTLALKDKYYHIYDYALWLINNEESKEEDHKGIIYKDFKYADTDSVLEEVGGDGSNR